MLIKIKKSYLLVSIIRTSIELLRTCEHYNLIELKDFIKFKKLMKKKALMNKDIEEYNKILLEIKLLKIIKKNIKKEE